MDIKQGTFTPLVFTTTGGMEDECVKYHGRLAELPAVVQTLDSAIHRINHYPVEKY